MTGLVERLEAHPEIAILGPVIREQQHAGVHCYMGGRDISRNLATRIPVDRECASHSDKSSVAEVDYVPGAVFLARREVFERVGLFDERFFFGGETADLCARARAMGYRSFVDLEALADHDARATPKSRRETLYTYYSLRNRMLYVWKYGSGPIPGRLSYWAVVYMFELGKAIGKGEFGKARAVGLALVHGSPQPGRKSKRRLYLAPSHMQEANPMSVLYLLTSPPPLMEGTDAVFQEVASLRNAFPSEALNLSPRRDSRRAISTAASWLAPAARAQARRTTMPHHASLFFRALLLSSPALTAQSHRVYRRCQPGRQEKPTHIDRLGRSTGSSFLTDAMPTS